MNRFWDDTVAGPQPDHGSGKLRKLKTNLNKGDDAMREGSQYQRSMSMPQTPGTPGTPTGESPTALRKENAWRRTFNPGSNPATNEIGAHKFDNVQPNKPTVYDWLYSDDTKSTYR